MTDYIRRIVSGNKARFKDSELHLELDLVYVTDHVIIMGYPASGLEGLYRNRREDTKKFLDHRHKKNYWIYNFCPIRENSYDKEFFEGRVSRYPFPDHHAPPLALLPLLARDINAWLSGSNDRVVALHCKAGKGRSGTMACTYLLTLDDVPEAPKLERSYDPKVWAKLRVDSVADGFPDDDQEGVQAHETVVNTDLPYIPEAASTEDPTQARITESPKTMTPASTRASTIIVSDTSNTRTLNGTLKDVLDLHTSRRMKATSPSPEAQEKAKQGVSIPSQRRWLYYWTLLLAGQAPSDILMLKPAITTPKVRLTDIKLRMKEGGGMKINLVKAVNGIFDKTGMARTGASDAQHHLWVSLARYDDKFVELIEKTERDTRNTDVGAHLGKGKVGTDGSIQDEFEGGKWDESKMVKSFARMGCIDEESVQKNEADKEKLYNLRPLSDASWQQVKEEIKAEGEGKASKGKGAEAVKDMDVPGSEVNSMHDVTAESGSSPELGIVLDANREVRVKFYMGSIFIGWLWIVPSFHMASPDAPGPTPTTRLVLSRKEIDFPLGVGANIIDVDIGMTWVHEKEAERVHPPTQTSLNMEPEGIPATLASETTAGAVEAKQAAKD